MLGGGGEEEEEVPHSFMCPILLEVMRDPHVLRETGHTFEKAAIEDHLRRYKTCPITGIQLKDTTIVPNHALRNAIVDYVE
ncbi:hypothetical protein GUITHDRAFT_71541, partial [Guillardia theta CCMP2712]